MSAIIDLTGHKYGHLTVIERAGKKNGRIAWLCECDCGNKIVVTSNALRTNNTKSCGCISGQKINLNEMKSDEIPLGRAKDLKGKKFNRLTALYRVKSPNGSTNAFWKCQCDCGNQTVVSATNLMRNEVKSCGCLFHNKPTIKEKEQLRNDEIPIGHALNLTGQRFGKLTVLYRTISPSGVAHNKEAYWKCKCDCGNIVTIRGSSLTRGTKSCGCASKEHMQQLGQQFKINELGNKYGRLTVIEDMGSDKHNKRLWKCRCECGNEIIIEGGSLRSGNTKSCGCLQKEITSQRAIKPISAGEKFGRLTVIKQNGKNKYNQILYLCRCDCGTITTVASQLLRSGHTQSCGCLKSKGELKISQILSDNQLTFQKEVTFENLINNNTGSYLRFDFFVKEQYLIEYDGETHYYTSGWMTPERLQNQQERDRIKNEYCKTHNIPLIRIPYWHYDKITIDDLRPETSQFLIT